MACHPDLVLRSKTSVLVQNQAAGTVCRLCNDQAEDAIVSQCKHLFDRECIRQYLDIQSARGKAVSCNLLIFGQADAQPECPVCHIEISIDLEAEAIDMDEQADKRVGKAKQGILSRLNLDVSLENPSADECC
jgi:DNA repair protein RAD16